MMRSFLAATLLTASGLALAQETSPAPETPEEPAGVLHFPGGERLPGTLVKADAEGVTWRSPLFADAPTLAHGAVAALLFTPPESVTSPPDPVAVTLRDGGQLHGTLLGFDDDWVNLSSNRGGEIQLRRSEVVSLRWLRQGGLRWNGPTGLSDHFYQVKPQAAKRWFTQPDGSIRTVGWKQRLWIRHDLPSLVEVEFKIHSRDRPEFEVQLLRQLKNLQIRTWDDEIVVKRGADFLTLLKVEDTDRTVHLRLFWNHENDSGMITTSEGAVLGQFVSGFEPAGRQSLVDGVPTVDFFARTLDPDSNRVPDSVTFNNFGRDLTVETLKIRDWDGKAPLPRRDPAAEGLPRVELLDGSTFGVFSGTIERSDGRTVTVRPTQSPGRGQSLPLDQIEAIRFGDLAPPPETSPSLPDFFDFSDGTRLPGVLSRYDAAGLTVETTASAAPLALTTEGLLRVDFTGRKKIEPQEDAAAPDRLRMDQASLSGRWVAATGPRPHWLLPGAVAAVPVAEAKSLDIQIADPSPTPPVSRPQALLHLEGGQSIGGKITTVGPDGAWVEISSPHVEKGRFAAASIRGVQFTGEDLVTDGFADRGWRAVRGKVGENLVIEDLDELVKGRMTVQPGGAWGHGSILQGNEITFTIRADPQNPWGGLRLRMFGTSPDSPDADCTRLLIAHFGNEVYCGAEDSPGDFALRQDIAADPGEAIPIRITWDSGKIELFAKGQKAVTIPAEARYPRLGNSLVFEPADLWNNGEKQMTVSRFSLKTSPGVMATPPIDAETRARALTVPRFRRDDPPRQILLAWTGDLLSGTIESATEDRFAIRAGLETHRIPAERVAAAIWLREPPSSITTEPTEPTEPEPETEKLGGSLFPTGSAKATAAPDAARHTLILRDGSSFAMTVDHFGPETITGHAESLGKCAIPARLVSLIQSGEGRGADPGALFANWQLEHAPEPSPPSGDGGGDANSPLLGKPAPPLELPVLGAEKRFQPGKGQIVILDFWATWCGPCVRALPEMIEAFSEFDPGKVAFVAVNQAEPPETITSFLKARGWPPFTVALDARQEVGRAYGVESIPRTVIIDADGKVAWVSTGYRPEGAAEAADKVRELLK